MTANIFSARTIDARSCGREDGNLIILGLGLWVFVLGLVVIVISALHLHNERRDLLARADALALDLAQSFSDMSYYAGGSDQPLTYSAAEVRAQALRLVSAEGYEDVSIAEPTGVAGDGVAVTLEATAELLFIPGLVEIGPHVVLHATSYASLQPVGADGVD